MPRADDLKVLNGIFWRLRTGSSWADIPERYGPPTTCYNRFVRWRKVGVWDRIFDEITKAFDGYLQSVDSSSIKVHQHASNAKGRSKKPPALAWPKIYVPSGALGPKPVSLFEYGPQRAARDRLDR